jgi:transcriptional regulator with XRE-family HTH domain
MHIGEVIRRARAAAGIPQKDLAQAIGVSPQMMNAIENHNRNLRPDHIKALPWSVREGVVNHLIAEYESEIVKLRQTLEAP